MLSFLFKKESADACGDLNIFYSSLKELYSFDSITDERKEYLKSTMEKYGYMPYPHIKALEVLTTLEVLNNIGLFLMVKLPQRVVIG